MERESLTLNFFGDDEIEIATLVSTLNANVSTLEIIAKNVFFDDNSYCKFVIKDIRKGSFIIDIDAIKNIVGALIPLVTQILPIYKEIFELRTFLKAKDPKKVVYNKIDRAFNIENTNGDIKIIDKKIINIYVNNPSIEDSFSKFHTSLYKDSSRSNLIISFDDGENIDIGKQENKELSEKIDTDTFLKSEKVQKDIVWLKILKAYFQGGRTWDFVLTVNGSKITAKINDEDFISDVKDGKIVISSNTKIEVELLTYFKEDENEIKLGRRTYEIAKVLRVERPQYQEKLTLV